MKTYRGWPGRGVMVSDSVTGTVEPLSHIVRHSPDGFSWGYHGSGPAELAHCILVDYIGEEVEPAIYQAFKADVIAGLPSGENWIIPSEFIKYWLRSNGFGHLQPRRLQPVRSEIEHRDRFVAETEVVDNEVELLNTDVECEVCGHGPTPAIHMVRERDDTDGSRGWVCWPCSRGEGSR